MLTDEIHNKINEARAKIESIENSIEGTRGVVQDTLNIVLPLHKSELEILEALAVKVKVGF